MKRIISIIICACLIITGIPICASAQTTSSEEMLQAYENLSNTDNNLFAPIIVDGENAYQGGAELETEVKKNELLVDVSSIVDEIENDEFDYSISTENGELLLAENSKNAVLVEDNTSKELQLDAKIISNDEAVLAPIDDIAELCNIESVEDDGKTVYVKPYQTKRLIVKANKIPQLDGIVNTVNFPSGEAILEFESEADTKNAYELLSNSKSVKSVTGENVYSVSEYSSQNFYSGENLSWGADYIDSPQAVEYATENNLNDKVVVGIVDTGIDTLHELLKDRISPLSTSVLTSTNNYENKIKDTNGHGTHVAGIIADNTPSNVEILAVKAINFEGYATDSSLAMAIDYAVSNGADVINMSFGGYSFWTENCLRDAISNAYNNGVICVAAAGNESMNARNIYPASSQYTITVGACDSNGKRASFSNYGGCVDVSAPGVNINSSYIATQYSKDSYASLSGTSMATPFVVAACAVNQTINGKKDFESLKTFVKSNVTELKLLNENTCGTGIISLTNYIKEERTQPVIFSELGGFFSNEITVDLSSKTNNAEIYYTLDGTIPSKENGTLYEAPLKISENTQVKAIAYSDKFYKSKRTMAYYRFDNYDVESNYSIDENGYITSYTGSITDLAIQEQINGIEVIGINDSVFRSSKVKTIILPDSVKQLGNTCFYGTNLNTIIAKGVIAIGDNCFSSLYSLKNVEFGNLSTIGKSAFTHCNGISGEGIDFSNVTYIGDSAFAYSGLSSSIDAPMLETIGTKAFLQTNIICIDAPLLEEVNGGTFNNCFKLEWARLDNLKAIKSSAFSLCYTFSKLYAPKLETIGDSAFDGCHKLIELTLDNVTRIGNASFRNTSITSVNLPKLEYLPNSAFMDMNKLETINLPKQDIVPASCFQSCGSLKEIPSAVLEAKEVGSQAFSRCGGIREVSLPNCVKLGYDAITDMNKLEKLDLPNVIEFGGGNFSSPYLKSITLPNCVIFGSISHNEYIEEINLPKATEIGYNGFMCDKALKTVNAPNLRKIKYGTFMECSSLESVDFPLLEVITGNDNFRGCKKLKEVIVPNCKTISARAFQDCTSLETVDLSSVQIFNYSERIFENTPSLKYLILRDLTEIHEYTFKDCVNIHELYLPNLVSISFSENGRGEYVDINLHMPKLNLLFLDNGEVANGFAIPRGARVTTSGAYSLPTTYYVTSDNNKFDSQVNYTLAKAPAMKTDLPEEYEFNANSNALELQVYSSNPKYEWFYSDNNESFTAISNNDFNKIIPTKSGYYYCEITDLENNETIKTNICKVSVNTEFVDLKLNFINPVNIIIGENLFVGIAGNSTLKAPKIARVQIMYSNEFDTLYVNKNAVEMVNSSFVFNATENANLTYKSNEKNLVNATATMQTDFLDIIYTGKPIIPVYKVVCENKELVQGVDYEIKGYNNINAGSNTAYVIIEGKGKYYGSIVQTFTIRPRVITSLDVSAPDQVYTGSALTPKPIVKFGDIIFNGGFSVSYSNNTKIGKASVRITPTSDNFSGSSKTGYFRIGIDISNALITLDNNCFVYNGFRQKPNAVFVQIGSTPLKEGVDYTIDFENNAEVGTARVVVKGIGDYVSTTYEEFEIVAPNIKKVTGLKVSSATSSQIKLTWSNVSDATSYQIYDTKLGKIVKTVSTNSATISSLNAGSLHNYKVRAVVKIAQKSFYGEYSAILKTCTSPKAPTIKSLTKKNNTITVKYSKPSGASGYQIAYSTSSSFSSSSTKYVTVSSASTVSKTIKSLKKGKKYYVKVRAYKTYQNSSGKTVKRYGSYSKYKSIKV